MGSLKPVQGVEDLGFLATRAVRGDREPHQTWLLLDKCISVKAKIAQSARTRRFNHDVRLVDQTAQRGAAVMR